MKNGRSGSPPLIFSIIVGIWVWICSPGARPNGMHPDVTAVPQTRSGQAHGSQAAACSRHDQVT